MHSTRDLVASLVIAVVVMALVMYLLAMYLLAACVTLSAAEPSIVTLDRSSTALTLDVVFKDSVTSGDCEITTPQNLQAQPRKTVLDPTDDKRLNLSLNSALVAGTKIEVLCASVGYKAGTADKTTKNLKATWTVPTGADYQKPTIRR
jgi:hypothetical protein